MKKGTSKFVARSKKKLGQLGLLLYGPNENCHVICHITRLVSCHIACHHTRGVIMFNLLWRICLVIHQWQENYRHYISDDVLEWSQNLVSDSPSVTTATSSLQAGSDRKQALFVIFWSSQKPRILVVNISFQRHQNQIQWIVAKFMGNSTSIRQDMPTMGLSIINVGEKKSYMATIVNQLHYYCKLIFSLLCQNNGPWVFR